jgi:Protein of unknown function (DUF2911)
MPLPVAAIFGGAGALQRYGKVRRLGADYATVLHTDADLDLNGLAIPEGDYTLYADLDNGQWKLIVNKTLMAGGRHIWGVGVLPDGIREGSTTDDPATELGRASLTMGKPSSLRRRQGKTARRMGECDGDGAVHREVAVSRGVYSAMMIPAHAAVGTRGVFPNCWTFTATACHL